MTTAATAAAMLSIEDKRAWIAQRLDDLFARPNKFELVALDFEVNLMACAAQSYKHETVLKPFPSTFLSDSNNNKNYEQLLAGLRSLPPVCEWKSKVAKFDHDQLALVYWLLVHKNFELEYTTAMSEERLKEMSKYTASFNKPNHVFEVKYSEEKARRFEALKEQTSQLLGGVPVAETTSINFHGTRMDNVYSILHIGLLSHFSKNALFGKGTYLSQEPSMCLHYSPACATWDKSLLGQRMSCVLVCETINDPQHVKVGVNNDDKSSSSNASSTPTTTTTAAADNSVPDKYFVVANNDYVRVRYVLVYAEKTKIKKKSRLVQLINENRFALLLICYSLLLLFIGLLNSRVFHKYIRSSYNQVINYLLGEASASID